MGKITYILAVVIIALTLFSCNEDEHYDPGFKDLIGQTIYDYIADNDSLYSKFDTILKIADLDETMGAYNPNGNGYTLFLPNNDAIDKFIEQSKLFSSFDELLANKEYVAELARYHVVNQAIITNDFPFGALPELNLDGQYLTISFETNADSSYYQVNNQSPVSIKNIEVSNGYIHTITKAIEPVTFTTYEWLQQNNEFSIYSDAVEITGFQDVLNRIVVRDTISESPVTLFVEPDSVYNRFGIYSLDDLIQKISPDNSEYTSEYNALNNFVGYHILSGSLFLSNFEENVTNYSTFGDNPININGNGIDLAINKGKEVFDTIISATNDTTYTDYITFYYDESNILTQSGAVHFINQLMLPKQANMAELYLQFYQDQILNQYREEGGEFLIEDHDLLSSITWTGGDDQIIFVRSEDESNTAWNHDYIIIEGEFTISFTTPKIVQGDYDLKIRAHAFDSENALVEVLFDGVKVGGLLDLTTGGNSSNPYVEFDLGTVSLLNYESHVITVQSLIPGVFNWDCVHFEPI